MRKLLIMILVATCMMTSSSSFAATQDNKRLTDIQGHWAEGSILSAVEKGYVSGYPDETFKPNNPVTRAEFIKMLVDALELPTSSGGSPWYQPYVDAAMKSNLHLVSDFSTYLDPIPRQEMALLAIRAVVGHAAYELKEGLYEATKVGIIHGTAPGELSPEGTTTRAQAIVVIERIIAIMAGEELPHDQYAIAAAELYWLRTNIFTVMPDYFNSPRNDVTTADVGMRYWDTDKLVLENEKFRAEIDELIAINLGDPNDPNRKLLPALDQMQYESPIAYPMPADAYIIITKYHIYHNYDPDTYTNRIGMRIRGFKQPNPMIFNKLVIPSNFVSLDDDFSHLNSKKADSGGEGIIVKVIPGSGYEYGDISPSISIEVFAIGYPGSSYDDYLNLNILYALPHVKN